MLHLSRFDPCCTPRTSRFLFCYYAFLAGRCRAICTCDDHVRRASADPQGSGTKLRGDWDDPDLDKVPVKPLRFLFHEMLATLSPILGEGTCIFEGHLTIRQLAVAERQDPRSCIRLQTVTTWRSASTAFARIGQREDGASSWASHRESGHW